MLTSEVSVRGGHTFFFWVGTFLFGGTTILVFALAPDNQLRGLTILLVVEACLVLLLSARVKAVIFADNSMLICNGLWKYRISAQNIDRFSMKRMQGKYTGNERGVTSLTVHCQTFSVDIIAATENFRVDDKFRPRCASFAPLTTVDRRVGFVRSFLMRPPAMAVR